MDTIDGEKFFWKIFFEKIFKPWIYKKGNFTSYIKKPKKIQILFKAFLPRNDNVSICLPLLYTLS